jgi:cell division protein FtsW
MKARSRSRTSGAAQRRVQRAKANAAADQSPGLAIDRGVGGAALLLIVCGVVMSYSSTATLALDETIPPLFLQHVGALVVGVAFTLTVLAVPTRYWRPLALPLWAFTIGLLVLTALFGVSVNGAQRWLELPVVGIRFQPVELCKFATLLAVAAVIARRDGHEELSSQRAMWAAALAIPPIALLLMQPDLGNAAVLACLVALLLVVAGTSLLRLIVPGLVMLGGSVVYIIHNDYARRRITGFLHPWENSQGEGWQLVQSFVAFARGGIFGQGLGRGQQKLDYLPEAHTDFILAVIAEESGLVGVFVVLGGFAALWIAGTRIATRSQDRFTLLIAFGMTALLTIPALLNASVVMGLVPTKGLPLPFLSYGRTSLIVCCVALGLLLGAARAREQAGPSYAAGAGGGRWP